MRNNSRKVNLFLFKEYKLVLNPEEELCLNTSLSTFIECLNLFGAASPTPNGGLGNTQTQTSSISSSTSLFRYAPKNVFQNYIQNYTHEFWDFCKKSFNNYRSRKPN